MKFLGYKLKSVTLEFEWLGNRVNLWVPLEGDCKLDKQLRWQHTPKNLKAANKIIDKVRSCL